MQEHDFIKRSLFPSDREGIEREERNYQELLVGLREEARQEREFWLAQREEPFAQRQFAFQRIQRQLYWNSLTFPEKAREHFDNLCHTTRLKDGAKYLFDKILKIILDKGMKAGEEKMVEWISRDVTRATPPELASPLEIEGSVVSEAYHYVILQFQSFQHHVQLSLEYLEQEYGDQLTEENVQDYFKVNPFLDDQEYNYLEEKLLKEHNN